MCAVKCHKKLAVLCRISSSLNTRSRTLVYKTCVKPHMEYCLLVCAYCGGEQAGFDRVLERARRVVTGSNTTTVGKGDFHTYGLACFADLMLLSVVGQYFYCEHNTSTVSQASLLSQINKTMQTRTSQSNKALIVTSKRCCDNCFFIYSP